MKESTSDISAQRPTCSPATISGSQATNSSSSTLASAMTRTARRDRVAVIDLQGLRNVAFKSEPMGFQVAAVGTGGEQMHGDIVSAVARHRQVECLGQMRNLHERGKSRRNL